jgi:catechol-2,3-dioxygenase
VELYCDKPKALWPRDAAGNLAMFTHHLDLRGLLREAPPELALSTGPEDL